MIIRRSILAAWSSTEFFFQVENFYTTLDISHIKYCAPHLHFSEGLVFLKKQKLQLRVDTRDCSTTGRTNVGTGLTGFASKLAEI